MSWPKLVFLACVVVAGLAVHGGLYTVTLQRGEPFRVNRMTGGTELFRDGLWVDLDLVSRRTAQAKQEAAKRRAAMDVVRAGFAKTSREGDKVDYVRAAYRRGDITEDEANVLLSEIHPLRMKPGQLVPSLEEVLAAPELQPPSTTRKEE